MSVSMTGRRRIMDAALPHDGRPIEGQYGRSGNCLICGNCYEIEWAYEAVGACGRCVCRLANLYNLAHGGEPDSAFCTGDEFESWNERHNNKHPEYAKKKISRSLRRRVFERDLYRCRSCGTHLDLTADHIHPESAGGPTVFENLQTLCLLCNCKKGVAA